MHSISDLCMQDRGSIPTTVRTEPTVPVQYTMCSILSCIIGQLQYLYGRMVSKKPY